MNLLCVIRGHKLVPLVPARRRRGVVQRGGRSHAVVLVTDKVCYRRGCSAEETRIHDPSLGDTL